jgi:hypothetical protein
MRGPVLCEATVNFDNYFLVNVDTTVYENNRRAGSALLPLAG